MRKLSKREMALLCCFLILVVLYVGVKYGYFPMAEKVKALRADKARYSTELKQMNLVKGSKETIQADIDQMRAQIDKLKPGFLTEESTYLYWREIVNRANQAGVRVTQMQEGDQKKQPDTRITQLRVSGLYSEVTAFMESLEQLPYVYAIIDGDIQKQGERADASFSIIISTKTY